MATNKTDTLVLLRQGDLENLSKVPVTEGALYVAKKKDSEGQSISAQLYVDLDSKRLSFKEEAAGENLGLVKTGGDVTITDGIISVNDNSHNHTISAGHSDDDVVILTGTAGTNSVTYNASHAEKGPANGYVSGNTETSINGYGDNGTIKIPQITVDKYGHVTAAADESITITMPTKPTTVETANKWTTARKLELSGDVTGAVTNVDGSSDISITTELSNTGVVAGTYGQSSNASPAHGTTFSVPSFTVDEDGRITSASTSTITLPADKNTDTKVTQTPSSDNENYPIILTSNTGETGTTSSVLYDTGVTVNPSTNTITATTFKGSLDGTAGQANKLSSAKNIALSGDVTGSVAFDGSDNVSITTKVNDKFLNHTITATAGDDDVIILTSESGTNSVKYTAIHSTQGPENGYTSGNETTEISGAGTSKTIKIPQITVDAYGHVKTANDESVVITLPEIPSLSKGTDVNVTATALKHGDTFTAITDTGVDGHKIIDTTTTYTLPNETDLSKGNDKTAAAVNLKFGDSFTVMTDTSVDGHKITDTNTTFTLPIETTYSTGTASAEGLTKLYTGTGSGTDGAMTQSATTTALNTKAPLASTTLTGTPKAPTAAAGTNTTQIATTAFVNTEINNKIAAADALIYKGTVSKDSDLPYTTAKTGWTYKVATAGSYNGNACEVGDMIICLTDGSSSTNATWTIIQTNTDGVVIGPSSAVGNRVAIFNGTTGKLIADSGYTIASSVPANAVFTDTNTKVTQTAKTDNVNYPLLLADKATPTSGSAATAVYDSGVTLNPSTNTIAANISGSAATLATGRTLTISGDVSGTSTSFNGGANATLTATLANSGVTAGSYGPDKDASPAHAGTFTVPYMTVDAKGRVTAASTKTITLPRGYSLATTSANGLMSATDKQKLNYTNIAYATCSTAAATAAKIITISDNINWTLDTGSMITVVFTETNTAENPTFNVNNTGAKNVFYGASQITTSSLSYAGYTNRPMNFMYDGTQYRFIGWGADSNTDTKVQQNAAITTAGEYPVLLAYSTSTSKVTNTVQKTSTLKYNPNTQILTAPTFKGNLTGNADTSDKWKTARTLTLAGAVEGSADLDGSTNVTLTVGENITGNLIGNADTATQWSSSISLKIGDIAQSLNGTEDLTYDLYDIIGDLEKFQETVVLPITNVLSEEIEVINTNIDNINEEIIDIRDKYLLKTDLASTLEQYVPYSYLNQIVTYTSEGTDLILHNNTNGSSQIKMTNSGIDLAADGTTLLSIADNSIIGQNYIVKDYLQIGEGSNKLQFKYEGTAGYSLMI